MTKITAPLLKRIEALWALKLSAREIALELEKEGRFLDKTEVTYITSRKRFRHLFPHRTREEKRQSQIRGILAMGKRMRSPPKKSKPGPPRAIPPKLIPKAAEMWARGLSAAEIAAALSTFKAPIYRHTIWNLARSDRDLFPHRRHRL